MLGILRVFFVIVYASTNLRMKYYCTMIQKKKNTKIIPVIN